LTFEEAYRDKFGLQLVDKRQCYARLANGSFYRLQRGHPVYVDGYEFDFIAHRLLQNDKLWTIIEGATGLTVCPQPQETQKLARLRMQDVLYRMNPDEFEMSLANHLLHLGHSPRYEVIDDDKGLEGS
jgi:hypothetical protein